MVNPRHDFEVRENRGPQGPRKLLKERELYRSLVDQGVSNAHVCRIVGVALRAASGPGEETATAGAGRAGGRGQIREDPAEADPAEVGAACPRSTATGGASTTGCTCARSMAPGSGCSLRWPRRT
jgi:hypothetical protein